MSEGIVTAAEAELERLHDRRSHAERDIEDVRAQVESGELDGASAERLVAGYEEEIARIDASLAALGTEPAKPKVAAAPEQPTEDDRIVEPRTLRRTTLIALVAVSTLTAAIVYIADRAFPDPEPEPAPASQSIEVGPATQIEGLGDMGLEELEQLAAAHPGTNLIHLALADAYLEAGENRAALEQYLFVSTNSPTTDEESRALTRIGYLAFTTGQVESARQYLQTAIEKAPGNPEASLFLGMVYIYGLGDATNGVPLLEEVAQFPDLPDYIRAQIDQALADAEQLP